MSNKKNNIKLDLSEFEGPEGIAKLLRMAQEFQQEEKPKKNQKSKKEKAPATTIQGAEEGNGENENDDDDFEDVDDSDDSGSIKAREGCSLAYDALNLKLIHTENDLNPLFKKDMIFKPDYVHQIFGQEEEIVGYEDLQINISILGGSLHTLIEYSYGKRAATEQDDFLKTLTEKCFVGGFSKKRKEFLPLIEKESSFKPIGDLFKSYTSNGQKFEIYSVNSQKHPEFSEYKVRMQVFSKLFIEVGSFVEDCEYWHYLISYKVDAETGQYTFVGFVNKYEFLFNINRSRHRISQVVVLPVFQRQGHATYLLESIYESSQQDEKCVEVTVEDPSANFQVVREIIETKIIRDGKFWSWVDAVQPKSIRGIFQLEGIHLEFEEEIRKKTKIPKHEIQRVFEILLLSKLDQTNKQVMDRYKGHFLKHNKDKNEIRSLKTKIPCIFFDNEQIKVDIQAILEQKKQMEPNDAFYAELYETALEHSNLVIQKLKM